jgi:hypothetical protein
MGAAGSSASRFYSSNDDNKKKPLFSSKKVYTKCIRYHIHTKKVFAFTDNKVQTDETLISGARVWGQSSLVNDEMVIVSDSAWPAPTGNNGRCGEPGTQNVRALVD